MAEQAQESKTLYGPRKLGEKAFAKQEAEQTFSSREATVYGSRKGGPPAPVVATLSPAAPPPTTPPVPAQRPDTANPFEPTGDENSSGYVTLSELADVLHKRPQLLDAAIEAEYRDGTPRKGAIELFLDIEANRKDGPRGDVIDRLTTPQGEDTDK